MTTLNIWMSSGSMTTCVRDRGETCCAESPGGRGRSREKNVRESPDRTTTVAVEGAVLGSHFGGTSSRARTPRARAARVQGAIVDIVLGARVRVVARVAGADGRRAAATADTPIPQSLRREVVRHEACSGRARCRRDRDTTRG